MALRIRRDRTTIECAAKSSAHPGDIYIGDQLQYELSVELNVIYPSNGNTPEERWHFIDQENGRRVWKLR